ncbi:hypothetical protein KLO14_18605 [Clostridioides difficile]|nr:hypothetical protein [Clostridioides difficile]
MKNEKYEFNKQLIGNLIRFISLVEECDLPYELEYCEDYTCSSIIGSNLDYNFEKSVVDDIDSCLSLKVYF